MLNRTAYDRQFAGEMSAPVPAGTRPSQVTA